MPRFRPHFFPGTSVSDWTSGEFGVSGWYPAAPTAVTPTEDDQEVALSWDAGNANGSDIVGYKIEKNDGSWSTVTSDTGSAATSYTVTGLTNGTAYTFRVTAINGVGSGEAPSAVTASKTPRGLPGTPGTLSLAAGSTPSTAINLSWSAPGSNNGSAITGYKIQYKTTGSWSNVVADTGSTSTTYSATGLTAGTTYYFRVASINAAGAGTYGNEPSRTTLFSYSTTGSPTERTYSGYKSLHWTGSGTFVVTGGTATIDILIVSGGGGGGGGYYSYGGGAGGGAGGMKEFTSQTVSVATHTITIGAGGGAGANGGGGSDGGDSSFAISGGSTLSTTGGGAGVIGTGRDGGSGAGGMGNSTGTAGQGVSGEGNAGGAGVYASPAYSGGGGGKGGTGGSGVSTGGAGGLYGTNYYADGNTSGTTDGVHRFAEGGGGAGTSNSTGAGGSGDGDGGGGAGGIHWSAGTAGRDGTVIIRWVV